jgi:hypothetical protein
MHLRKDKQALMVAVFLVISASSVGQTGKSFRFRDDGDLQETNVVSEKNYILLNYSIPFIDINELSIDQDSFFRLSIPGHISTTSPGKPELPVFSRLIRLPEEPGYRVKISEVITKDIDPGKEKISGLLYPAQEGQTKELQQKKPEFLIDKSAYASKGFIPSDTVIIEYVGTARNNKLATLSVYPVSYDPHTNRISIIISMKIEIFFTATDNSLSKSLKVNSSIFSKTLDKSVLNYNPYEVIPGYSEQPVKMVILTDTIFKKSLEPFFRWKTQKGFDLRVLYMGPNLAGTTYNELKDTLTKIYKAGTTADPSPEYLLIIGDVNRIPTYTAAGGTGNFTDMYYGEFDGEGDYIPEMFIGRLPVADTNELKAVVKKIVQYEKFEFPESGSFLKKALVTGGNDTNFIKYMNGQVKYAITNYLTKENGIDEFHFSYPASLVNTVPDSIKKIINQGVSFVNYTGHGSSDGWLYTANGTNFYLKQADIAKLTNNNMYPFVISNACRTGQYNNASSLANKMVLAEGKGALGFIGCSNDSYWDEDFYWSVGPGVPSINPTYEGSGLGAYDRLFHTHGEVASEWYSSMGQINYAGNLAVSASTTLRKKYYWETYNLVGDPSVQPIIGKPGTFNFVIPDTLPNGIRSLLLNIDPFAYMAISHADSLLDASHASQSGSINLELPELKNDSCLIVVTGQNKIPLIKRVYFSIVTTEFINLTSVEINDSTGDNNKRVDFGEFFYLNLSVNNHGLTDASNLYAKISSESEALSIKTDSVWIGTLAAGTGISLPDALGMTISGNIKDLGSVTVNLVLKDGKTEKRYSYDIIVHAPEISIVSFTLDDTVLGNGNHIADPGETFNLIFRVSNKGSSSISGQFNVFSLDNGLTVLEPSVKSGLLKFGETTDIPVQVKISPALLSGSYFSLISTLDCTPFLDSKEFTFRVGKVRESFEAASFDVFPWINFSPLPWVITSASAFEGGISARSGGITHNGVTSLVIRTIFPSQDSIQFYYKVSTEAGYDFFSFMINDIEVIKNSGEKDWTKAVLPVSAGLNRFEWAYKKDNSVSGGSDCVWIDKIDFTKSGSLSYIQKDLKVAKIVSPVQTDAYAQEIVTVKVLNLGKDVIKGFNLAYSLNRSQAVRQNFDNQVIPYGDSVSVSFRTRADLSKYGLFNLVVYAYDNDDEYQMNDTLQINIENTEINETFSLYPNPFSNDFTVFINSRSSEKAEFSVINLSGKKIFSIEKYILSGKNEIKISGLKIAPALYYLKIKGTSINKTIPVLKVNK